MALFAQGSDTRQCGHDVRHQNRQRHFEQPGVRHLAFENGIPVVDQDENNTHNDRVFERAFDDGGLQRKPERLFHQCRDDRNFSDAKQDMTGSMMLIPHTRRKKICIDLGCKQMGNIL